MTSIPQAVNIRGVSLTDTFRHADARGQLWRLLPGDAVMPGNEQSQVLVTVNHLRLTLRGMHFQTGGAAERKVVVALRGRVYDVVADLRIDSPTYLRWGAIILDEALPRALIIPPGVAHGYLTLDDDSMIAYLIDQPFDAESASGARWDDPLLGIEWPSQPEIMSEQDRNWELLAEGFNAV